MSLDPYQDSPKKTSRVQPGAQRENLSEKSHPEDESQVDSADCESDVAAAAADTEVVLTVCWRCEKAFPSSLAACNWCAAKNRNRQLTIKGSVNYAGDKTNESTAHGRQLRTFFITFSLLLISSVIHGGIMLFGVNSKAIDPESLDIYRLTLMTSLEVVDTFLVLYALLKCRDIIGTQQASRHWIPWLLFLPLMIGLISINFWYHHLVQAWLGPEERESLMTNQKLFWWVLLTFCLQPAIVEELFVRYLMLGMLRQHTHTGTAILISSLAFALLHLGAPLSIPYLFLAGMVFGYFRVASGGLLLPMFAHFIHNLIVVIYQQI